MKKFLVALMIVVVTTISTARADDNLLLTISDFELVAQKQLELMVVNNNVDVALINSQVTYLASKIGSLSSDDKEIASNILSEVSRASALVEARS